MSKAPFPFKVFISIMVAFLLLEIFFMVIYLSSLRS
jgi:hypothetical protein